ncbi:phosphatase PAP2 family protein [Streptomyces sp. cg35]|uniref:phosphatase PAP2 family protein n=1 Tax=Streptomyces sp. cg35 TaxID=3421650 RepID=UPI003D181E91
MAKPPPARARAQLLASLTLLLVPLATGVSLRAGAPHPLQVLDDTWLRWMGGPHKGVAATLASALNWFGGPYGALVPLAATALLLALRRPRQALFVFTATLLTHLAVQALKHVVDRPRPAHPLVTVDHGSFPSGHAATMAMTVVAITALLPAAARRLWYPAATLLTLAMMWSRTWLHAHWLSDTMAGAVAGTGVTLLVWWAFGPLRRPADPLPGTAAQAPGRRASIAGGA